MSKREKALSVFPDRPGRGLPTAARRDLLKAAVGGLAAGAFGIPAVAYAQASGGNAALDALSGDVHVLAVGGMNVVCMANPEGVVLVDAGPAGHSAALLELLATLPGGGTVHTLFNTCWHSAQTGFNEQLGRDGVTIIAHENTRLWLTTDITWPWDGSRFEPLPEVARPNKTFYGREELSVAGKRIEYGHLRACPHTDGDSYVYFRDANVLAVGDTVRGDGWPTIDWWTGGWIGGVVGALELLRVIADDDTRIVPARGRVMSRADIVAQHEMFDVIYERLVGLLYDGKSPEEAVAARPTAEFDAKMGRSDEFVTRAFESLWGYLTPDA